MEYPSWYVPFITAPMLIPFVAIPHVIVAQFAVGGGILLAYLVSRAYKENISEAFPFLKGLAKFFILITIVFGAVTGLGIWWSIGLTSPETTQALINIFVFAWATEWVFFVLEIVSAFCFYYLWDKLLPREHIILGWIYAISALFSLVIITAITSFMLNTGNWSSDKGFFSAIFNPLFIPQTLIRTGGSLAISALWIGIYTSFYRNISSDCKNTIIRWISRWALGGMILIVLGGGGYFANLPEHAWLNMMRAPMLIIFTVINFGITLLIIIAFAIGVKDGHKWINPPSAILVFLMGAMAIVTGEFIREGARKPYRIEKLILSPGIFVKDISLFKRDGFISNVPWLKFYAEKKIKNNISYSEEEKGKELGKAIFQYHCGSCHAVVGYNGIKPLISSWTPNMIKDGIANLHRANPAMPVWLGSDAELEMLILYLSTLREQKK